MEVKILIIVIVIGLLIVLLWSLFRSLIKDGVATTTSPYLFLLRKGDYRKK